MQKNAIFSKTKQFTAMVSIDVIFFCRGWSDLDKISETGAEWHVEIETRCRIPIWRTFGRFQWDVIPEPLATLKYMFLPVFVCLSVCLYARLLKDACMDLDDMLRVDWCRDMDELINFWADPDRSPDPGTGLLSPISYKRCYRPTGNFTLGESPRIPIGGPPLSEAWF